MTPDRRIIKRRPFQVGLVVRINAYGHKCVEREEDGHFCEVPLSFDEAESSDLSEMASVECGHLTTPLQSRCPHNQVIEANHFARNLQFGPDAGVFIRRLLGIGDNRHGWPARQPQLLR